MKIKTYTNYLPGISEGPEIVEDETYLKPCPFCGGEAVVIAEHYPEDSRYLAHCSVCEVSNDRTYHSKREVVEAWNRRTT